MSDGWAVVVPVKLLSAAKSRLAPYADEDRAALALAFAEDLLGAVLACPGVSRVLVVTDDERVAHVVAGRAEVLPDAPEGGLNPALAAGAEHLRRSAPGLAVAALASDLPALRPGDLAAALVLADGPAGRWYVPDAAGTGTTLLAVAPGRPLDPGYGPGSRERHRAGGAVELPAAPSLRRDVDTPEDLQEAIALGVGPATRAVLERGSRVLAATVAAVWTGGVPGSVVLDDGRRLTYPARAVRSEVRSLALGQRVRLRVAGEPPTVQALTLAGLPLEARP